MFDEILKSLMGENFELLKKPSIYATVEEKWNVLRALLFTFGCQVDGDTLLVPIDVVNEEKIDLFKEAIERILDSKIEVQLSDDVRDWRLSLLSQKK